MSRGCCRSKTGVYQGGFGKLHTFWPTIATPSSAPSSSTHRDKLYYSLFQCQPQARGISVEAKRMKPVDTTKILLTYAEQKDRPSIQKIITEEASGRGWRKWSPNQLAHLKLASLRVDGSFWGGLGDACESELDRFATARDLSTSAYAFAKIKVRHDGFFQKLATACQSPKLRSSWSPRCISNVVWAFNAIQWRNQHLMAYFTHLMVEDKMREEWTAQSVANIIYAYASLRFFHPELLRSLSPHLQTLAFDPQGATNILWSLGILSPSYSSSTPSLPPSSPAKAFFDDGATLIKIIEALMPAVLENRNPHGVAQAGFGLRRLRSSASATSSAFEDRVKISVKDNSSTKEQQLLLLAHFRDVCPPKEIRTWVLFGAFDEWPQAVWRHMLRHIMRRREGGDDRDSSSSSSSSSNSRQIAQGGDNKGTPARDEGLTFDHCGAQTARILRRRGIAVPHVCDEDSYSTQLSRDVSVVLQADDILNEVVHYSVVDHHLAGKSTASGAKNSPNAARSWAHHDRSGHAERRALEKLEALEREPQIVSLKVSMRPCVTCVVALIAYRKAHPRVRMYVSW